MFGYESTGTVAPPPTKQWLIDEVTEFIATSELNRMGEGFGDEPMWGPPRVRFANGADPLFEQYKDPHIVGPAHWTPLEAFNKVYPDAQASAEDITVVNWILPQTPVTKDSMKRPDSYPMPSERWARGRVIGETINEALRKHMMRQCAIAGFRAVAPVLLPEWERLFDVPYRVITSKWSERHAAYAAGQGTFGLCDALITPVGKAHRTGSILFWGEKIEPDPRPYTDPHEWCLYHRFGTCAACTFRCPVGAITKENGHDKNKCKAFMHTDTPPFLLEHYGLTGYACGFCQVSVPCQDGIPAAIRKADNIPDGV
jgi:ferredoxin